MNRLTFVIIAVFIALSSIISNKNLNAQSSTKIRTIEQAKRDFVDLRFGMFICYNIMSYGAYWGEADYPIDSFNPQKLDCNQWADAAVSAGMKYGLLTTKHHEGFCLWDSKFTKYDVASTPYKKDIVKQYSDAFRRKGLKVGLYYSIWDSSNDIDKGMPVEKNMEFVKGQITELLTQYGKIDYFVTDGWFWRMGHHEISFHEIRNLIRELQPECLLTDHTHFHVPYHLDIPYFEGPYDTFPEEGNIIPTSLGHCSVKGNGWFWGESTPNGLKENDGVDVIVDKLKKCEKRYCNFMLNCMPNRDGLLNPIYIGMLDEIGKKWKPDNERPSLPRQGKQLVYSVPFANVTATSGIAHFLYDACMYKENHFHWESDASFPQTLVIDMGEVKKNIDMLTIVQNHKTIPKPELALEEGNILHCKVYSSIDNKNFTQIAEKKWKPDNLFRSIDFEKQDLRFIKIEILDANGPKAIIAELEVGRSSLE